MSHVWPSETAFRRVDLDVKDRDCGLCDTPMHVCSHRQRRLFTFEGPWLLVVKLVHCPDPDCPGHRRTISSPEEMAIALPRLPQDNLDLERWFRRPKGHERGCISFQRPATRLRSPLLAASKSWIPRRKPAFAQRFPERNLLTVGNLLVSKSLYVVSSWVFRDRSVVMLAVLTTLARTMRLFGPLFALIWHVFVQSASLSKRTDYDQATRPS